MLDKTDLKTLLHLDLDGRIPLTDLAEKVGVSKQALNYRLKNLVKEKYILGYIAIIDIHKLGLLTYRLYLRFAATGPQKSDRFIDHLIKHPNTLFVGKLAGSWDCEAVFVARNFIHFSELVKDLRASYGKMIHRMDISMTPIVYVFRRDYLQSETRKSQLFPSYGKEPVPNSWDELDFAILGALSIDCRVTYDELAKDLKVSNQTVKNRIQRLEEEKVIRGYRTQINTKLLNRTYVKALLELAPITRKEEQELYAACAKRASVTYLTEVLGTWQLEIEAEVSSLTEVDQMMHELRSEFPGVIVDFQTVTVTEECKLNYLPSGKTTRDIIFNLRK